MSNYITERKSSENTPNHPSFITEVTMKSRSLILIGLIVVLMLASTSIVMAASNNGTPAAENYAHCSAMNSSLPMVGNFSGDDIYDPAAYENPAEFALNAEVCSG
jgi:uncharacterized membrane protein YkvI